MTDVEQLITELNRRGVELRPRGERIEFRPAGKVTPELRQRLKDAKPFVLAWLKDRHVEALIASIPATATGADVWARRAAALIASVDDDDKRMDYRETFEHRAGVCEFCGNLPRIEAERIAFIEISQAMREAGDCA